MEDAGDSEFAPYMREQGAYARRVLDAIPGRAAMAKRVTALSADAPTVRYVQPVHDRLFVEERPRGADNFKVYVRDSARGQARLLIDPTRLPGNDTHTSLDWWRPRPMRVTFVARGASRLSTAGRLTARRRPLRSPFMRPCETFTCLGP